MSLPVLSLNSRWHRFFFVVLCAGFLQFSGCASQSSISPVRWELSPEATITYGILLLEQAMRHDDKHGVLEAVQTLFQQQGKVGPQPFVDAAAWFLINKETEDSRRILLEAIKQYPGSLSLHLLLSETWNAEGNGVQAILVLKEYQRQHPDSVLIRQELAILKAKLGLYKEAVALFLKLPQRLYTPYIRFCYAQALAGLHQNDAAIAQLRLAVQEQPEYLEAWLELGKLLEKKQQFNEALKIYSSLLEQDPANQEVWLRIVEGELKAGRPGKALETVQNGPDSDGFQLTALTLFLEEKQFKQAELLLERLKKRPGTMDELVFYSAALAYEYRKDIPTTLELLASVPETSRFFDRSLRLRVQLYYESGQPEEALAVVRQGKTFLPDDLDFRMMEIHLLLGEELTLEALEAADEALKTWADDEDLLYLRGTILDTLERKTEAVLTMEQILTKNPDAYRALNYIGYTLAEQGTNLERALSLLQRAARLQPDMSYIQDSLAWALYRNGQIEEAWNTIRRAVQLPDGGDPTIWEHYGDIAAALGKQTEARRGWVKALEQNPANADEIRKKLERQ